MKYNFVLKVKLFLCIKLVQCDEYFPCFCIYFVVISLVYELPGKRKFEILFTRKIVKIDCIVDRSIFKYPCAKKSEVILYLCKYQSFYIIHSNSTSY